MKSNQSLYLVVSFVFLTLLTFTYIDLYSTRLLLSQQIAPQVDVFQPDTTLLTSSLSNPAQSSFVKSLLSHTNSLMLISSPRYAALRGSSQVNSSVSTAIQVNTKKLVQSNINIATPPSLQTVNNVSPNDFQSKVLNPDLMKLNIYSPAASNLLLGTAIQESLLGKLSKNVFQITLSTAEDINSTYLVKHPDLRNAVNYFYDPQRPLSWNLSNNVNYEVAIASIVYLRANRPLPNATDPEALGLFWKKNYNTYFGKGTAREYALNLETYLSKDHQLATQFRA